MFIQTGWISGLRSRVISRGFRAIRLPALCIAILQFLVFLTTVLKYVILTPRRGGLFWPAVRGKNLHFLPGGKCRFFARSPRPLLARRARATSLRMTFALVAAPQGGAVLCTLEPRTSRTEVRATSLQGQLALGRRAHRNASGKLSAPEQSQGCGKCPNQQSGG